MKVEQMDPRRKRILFHSRRRGMQENDILVGKFVEQKIGDLTEVQLDQLEALIEEIDPDILDWIIGRQPVPAPFDNEIMAMIREFNKAV